MKQKRSKEKIQTKPTIAELEVILDSDVETPIEILPNGSIRALNEASCKEMRGKVPLTMREDLGGEYSVA